MLGSDALPEPRLSAAERSSTSLSEIEIKNLSENL